MSARAMQLRDRREPERPGSRPHFDDHRLVAERPPVIRCVRCRAELAALQDVMPTPGGGLFVNPAGLAFEIVRVVAARNVAIASRPTLEATWFAGYAWSIIVCTGCGTHVGWRYDTTAGASPPVFFGLLSEAITLDSPPGADDAS